MDTNASQGEEALLRAIRSTPIIDNHAHPLLKRDAVGKHPLLSIATEAHGTALDASMASLAHLRVVEQLSSVLGCDRTWEAVAAAINAKREGNYEAWINTCLSGIQCVLVDDGLDSRNDVESYDYLDKFTSSPAKRIVRIERVAEALIEDACMGHDTPEEAYWNFKRSFEYAISQAISDPQVAGFKSVICYRTGLAIPRTPSWEQALSAFQNIFHQRRSPGAEAFSRINHRGLNEYLVHSLAGLVGASERRKPIQFHTGLGDNDITLTSSSPSHLQDFIREYPMVPIVLLHSGYPFVRETGYLAAMYSNVYADIGEVFPFLSRDGQEGVVRQILELCPSSKILWSTDGHWFPETYFLAVVQMREVLETVLCNYVRKGDLSWQQAVRFVEDILFHSSNNIYRLHLQMHELELSESPARNNLGLSRILELGDSARFLRVCWNDMTATTRMRAIPIRRVISMLQNNENFSFGVTKGTLGMIQTDFRVHGVSAVGEWRLHPDLDSLRVGPRKGHVTVMSNFKEQDGSAIALCPRTLFQRALMMAGHEALAFALGFEIEVLILRRTGAGYEALNGFGHAWSVARAMDHDAAVTVIESAVEQLDAAGVYVEMVHPESASGQYEIILPKAPPLEAVDTLLFARDVISCCATAHGYKASLHPKPFADGCGTAGHVHMSITSPGGSDRSLYEPFYAGILNHLRAITAFTCSNLVSYERVRDGCWAGGTWVTWGTQNREAPLRKIEGSHWELKSMDGLANPYLAMSAILLAGLNGVMNREEMTWKDCTEEPASLSDKQRQDLGLRTKLPSSLQEALAALEKDLELRSLLGEEFVERYVAVKKAEIELLESMDEGSRRQWIMERY
ncbi:Protein fluG [Tolypocladium ophioglossoides CBS 100239]|uniref:Glutamine synthetase n=1 Tax=Tolypocladium ophioglossoides (strain CBS 100239) TaxID=1163406 RepID=A0A0L0MY55_TOLOC|nr:Protein fluG [Tolypocladium ophioglossoides CBS 100239]